MTDTIYKLTDQLGQTHGGTQWTPGEWHETNGEGELCGPGWLHAYDDPLVAVFMNPIHACIDSPRLWVGEAKGKRLDNHGLKCGYTRMRVLREIQPPGMTPEQRIIVAILCAVDSGYDDPDWIAWAIHCVNGDDRSTRSWPSAAEAWAAAARMAAARAEAAARAVNVCAILHEVIDGGIR